MPIEEKALTGSFVWQRVSSLIWNICLLKLLGALFYSSVAHSSLLIFSHISIFFCTFLFWGLAPLAHSRTHLQNRVILYVPSPWAEPWEFLPPGRLSFGFVSLFNSLVLPTLAFRLLPLVFPSSFIFFWLFHWDFVKGGCWLMDLTHHFRPKESYLFYLIAEYFILFVSE